MSVNLEKVLNKIKNEKTNKLKPENIRYGTNIMGVQGVLKPVQIDGGDIGMQMYLQDTTPEAQDGIWVNTNKTINDIYIENEAHTTNYSVIYSNDTTDDGDISNIIKGRTIPVDLLNCSYCQKGNIVHFFGFYSSTASQNVSPKINQHYMYNFDTDTWTRLSDTPTPMGQGACEWVDNDTIYIIGSAHADYYKYVYKYTISTDTFERLEDVNVNASNLSEYTVSNIANNSLTSCYVDRDNCIYFTPYNYLYKYDIATGVVSFIINLSINGGQHGKKYVYDGTGIIFGSYWYGNITLRKYNFSSNTITNYGHQFYGNSGWYANSIFNVNGIIYNILGGIEITNTIYVAAIEYQSAANYNTIYGRVPTNTSSFSSNLFRINYPICSFTNENYDILLGFAGTSGASSMIGIILNDKHYEFDNDTIILYTDSGNGGRYTTELYKNERVINGGKIKQQFTDVNIYDKSQEKIIKNLTTYYGNGTSWVKIK